LMRIRTVHIGDILERISNESILPHPNVPRPAVPSRFRG
jgi:hypothetical protein